MADRVRTLAVDFDGVIHGYSRGWSGGEIYDPPVPGALEALRVLMGQYAVFVFTSRPAGQAAEWLIERGFDAVTHSQAEGDGPPMRFWSERGRLLVTDRKLPAAAYLDDRAVRFTSWPAALAELAPGAREQTPPSYTCPKCRRTSYHPEDVANRYCGACHQFHDQAEDVRG